MSKLFDSECCLITRQVRCIKKNEVMQLANQKASLPVQNRECRAVSEQCCVAHEVYVKSM